MDLCEYALELGETLGADELEVMWAKNVNTTVEAELGQICTASKIRNEGLRIRVIKNKALGSSFTYRMDQNSIEKAVKNALNAAQISKKDEYWDSLPSPGKYPHVDSWDTSMVDMNSEDLMDPVSEILQAFPDDIFVHFAGNEITLKERRCVNSQGITHEEKGTMGRYGIMAVGMLKDGVTPGFQEVQHLKRYNPDPQRAAESILEKVALFKHADTASSGKSPVVISPPALQELLYYTLFKALSGENVFRGKSLLTGREGEEVASSKLTLHDNGVTREGVNSSEMDDEGVPCQDTALIEKGILKGFIWNDYWAKRRGVTSTGNGHYDDRINEMLIQVTTMVVSPGDFAEQELFDVEDGYYVLGVQGAHGSNPESGDFSVLCSPAYRIRNGVISGGCTGMMLSDNIFSLLFNIDAVGRVSEVVDAAILPLIRFNNVNVVART